MVARRTGDTAIDVLRAAANENAARRDPEGLFEPTTEMRQLAFGCVARLVFTQAVRRPGRYRCHTSRFVGDVPDSSFGKPSGQFRVLPGGTHASGRQARTNTMALHEHESAGARSARVEVSGKDDPDAS